MTVEFRDYIVTAWMPAVLLGCPQALEDRFSLVQTTPGSDAGIPVGDDERRFELVHRYSFDAAGSVADDSVGTAPGRLMNGPVSGQGVSTLAGGNTRQYVDLPNGIISSLGDATFECWLTWKGGDPWQRILDFGTTVEGEDAPGTGRSYVFLTPMSSADRLRAAFSVGGFRDETTVDVASPLPANVPAHVALVMNDSADRMSVYVDGEPGGAETWRGHLRDIDDVNNWIGRSQFGDADLSAELLEFRIYATALDAAQVRASFRAGPEASAASP